MRKTKVRAINNRLLYIMSGMNRRKVEKISKKVRCDHVRSGKTMQVKVWSDKAKKVRESPGKVGKI